MNRLFWWALIMYTGMISACRDKAFHPSEIKSVAGVHGDTGSYSIKYDSLVIPIDTLFRPAYLISAPYYSAGSNEHLFYGYNKPKHSIDIISLTNRKTKSNLRLSKKGSYAFGDLLALYVNSTDSIFVIDNFYIGLLDSSGVLRKRWAINSRSKKDDPFFSEFTFFVKPPCIFAFNKFTNELYVQAIPNRNIKDVCMGLRNHEEDRFIAKFNIISGHSELLPASYDGIYKENYYGSINQPAVNFAINSPTEVKLTYIFPASPSIYSYTLGDTSVFRYVCTSRLSANQVEPLDIKEANDEVSRSKHFHRNINFCSIISDSASRYKFRFHYDRLDDQVVDYSNVYLQKNLILTVLDNDYSIVTERIVNPNTILPLLGFTYGDGVALPLVNPKIPNQNNFKLLILKLHKNV